MISSRRRQLLVVLARLAAVAFACGFGAGAAWLIWELGRMH